MATPWVVALVSAALAIALGKAYRAWIDAHQHARIAPYESPYPSHFWERWTGWTLSTDMRMDPLAFVERARKSGPVLRGGRSVVLLSPHVISSAHRLPASSLETSAAARLRLMRQTTDMAPAHASHPLHASLVQAVDIFHRGTRSSSCALRFAQSLLRQIDAFKSRKFSSRKSNDVKSHSDFASAVRRLVQAASLTALFGADLVVADVTQSIRCLAKAMRKLELIPLAVQAVACPAAVKARRHLVHVFQRHITHFPLPESGPMSEILQFCLNARWSTADIARFCIAVAISATAEAQEAVSWATLHSIQAGEATVSALRSEAKPIFMDSVGTRIQSATVDANIDMPITTDVVLETLRMYSMTFPTRILKRDVVLEDRLYDSAPTLQLPKPVKSVSFGFETTLAREHIILPTPPGTPPTPALKRTASSSSTVSILKSHEGEEQKPKGRQSRKPIFVGSCSTLLLCNPVIQYSEYKFGSDPKVWRPNRWLDDNHAPLPLDGSMIETRHWNLVQLRLSLAALFHHFNITFPTIPATATSVMISGLPHSTRHHNYDNVEELADDAVVTTTWSPGFERERDRREGVVSMRGGLKVMVQMRH